MNEQTIGPETPALLASATQFDMTSRHTGRTYRIFVSLPLLPPPPDGYPVVLATDANYAFPIVSNHARLSQASELPPAIIVGVGYPIDEMMAAMTLRNVDLTPPADLATVPPEMTSGMFEGTRFGEAEPFYSFLIEELRPHIALRYPVDPAKHIYIGDSLGGLFGAHVLLNHPGAFRAYVLGSPALWWNDHAIFDEIGSFAGRVAALETGPRVFVSVGSLEQDASASPPSLGMSSARHEELIVSGRMVDNARTLARQLAEVDGPPGYQVVFHEFEGETHFSVIPATISKGLAFALKG